MERIGRRPPAVRTGPSLYRQDGEVARFPEGAYSSDYFADRLIEFIEAGAGDSCPLFGYLAFTAPHSPLQAPDELIAQYRGRYDAGPEALREARLARMRAIDLADHVLSPRRLTSQSKKSSKLRTALSGFCIRSFKELDSFGIHNRERIITMRR
jgi:arylsulfatase A-like enzyme